MGSTPVSPPQARPLGRLQASGRGVVGVIGPFPLLPAGLGTRPCGCVVTGRAASADLALALTSPCRVCRPGRLPAPVLQRPGPAHEGGGHVWMLPACVCRELPVVGAKTPVPRGYILKSAAGGGAGVAGNQHG